MQDRYAGDIGDYGKIGLLKTLQDHGFKIGINWYRTDSLSFEKKADGTFKQDDGKYIIPEEYWVCDSELAGKLTDIAFDKKGRSISAIEKSDFVPEAKYYSDLVTVDKRVEWHQNALNNFTDCNLVFLDPDNGLLVKSVGKKSSRSVKYVFYEEVKDYIDKGISVIVYNHRSRKKSGQYFGDIEHEIYKYTGIPVSAVQEITFPRMSVRDYFAIPASEEHFCMIKDAFTEMLDGIWGRTGMCTKSIVGDSWKKYITKEDYIFLEETCRVFHDNQSIEDYRKDIHRWLQLTYGYNSEYAYFLIDKDREYIKECYQKQESVDEVATEVGFLCG